jgi:hypothetical protein
MPTTAKQPPSVAKPTCSLAAASETFKAQSLLSHACYFFLKLRIFFIEPGNASAASRGAYRDIAILVRRLQRAGPAIFGNAAPEAVQLSYERNLRPSRS